MRKTILITGFLVALLLAPLALGNHASGRPAACEEGESCTNGQWCCWTTAGGHYTALCAGGTWGPSTSCGNNRECSSQGVGGECQSTATVSVSEFLDSIQFSQILT